MPDMNFPRYMFAVGGAGKNLLYTILEKEWVLKEIIKPKFAPTIVEVTIIDTAIDEENADRERIEKIDNNIKRLTEEYRSNLTNTEGRVVGRIDISYMLLTKDMILQSPYDLIGVGKEVKRATGASVWWINDPEKLGEDWQKKVINRENFKELNFTKGVYRKRAIGKAIYYKAVSEGKFDIDLLQTAQVDILFGLGGGTGSGMAFDLAKKLKSIQPTADITLFGVMSTLEESPDEKANNFAMISEIEYGCLHGDTPFKDIIFIPMEVTRYPGRERASDRHESLLKEFDETVPYILMSYHNNPAQRFFVMPEYAPFIIATSQLVRYNVASIKRLKDKLIDALNDKDASLKDEDDIYNAIRKFIDEFYIDEPKSGQLPDEDKTFIKDDRFSRFKIVLDHQFFRELDYNSVKYLKKAVDAGIAGSGSDDIEKQISSIKAEVETISIGEEGYKEDADLRLHKILRKDVEIIGALKDLLSAANKIQNNVVRDTLKIIIKADEYSLGRKLNQIREELDKLNGRKKQLEGSVKTLEEDIKNYNDTIRIDIDKKNQEWKQNEIRNVQLIDSVDDMIPMLNNDIVNLKNELEQYVTRINSANNIKNVETESTRNIENIVDRISQELEKIGSYYEDRGPITKSIINVKEFKKANIIAKKRLPIFDSVIGIVVKTGRAKARKEATNRMMTRAAELNSDKIFGIKDGVVSCIYNYDVDRKTNERKVEIIDGIIKRTQEMLPNTAPSLFLNIKDELSNPAKRKLINIDELVKSNLGYDTDIQKKDLELKEKHIETNQISEYIRQFRSLETILKNNTPAIKRHSGNLKDYYAKIANIEKDVVAMHSAGRDVVRYIMEMQPTNIYKATLTGANINNILVDKDEASSLKQNLQGGLERTIDNRYNTLVRRVIETADNMKRWDKTKVMNTFVTMANIDPNDIDSKRTITNAFSITGNNYSQWKCPSGDAWEVGIVLFIAGVPFDNIRNIIDPRAGYHRFYQNVDNSENIFFHHSYMLEEGKFVKRNKVFNIEDENDKILFLNSDKEIKSMFLENYEEKDIKECLKKED